MGSGEFFLWEFPMVHWLESQGYDVSYQSNTDTHAYPDRLLKTHGLLSVGHDEYWTLKMYRNVERAIQAPQLLNMDAVHAQIARQALDMLVGFKITPTLWSHVAAGTGSALSAGRCQTPALRLIYDNQCAIDEQPIRPAHMHRNTGRHHRTQGIIGSQHQRVDDLNRLPQRRFRGEHDDRIQSIQTLGITDRAGVHPLAGGAIQRFARQVCFRDEAHRCEYWWQFEFRHGD